MVDLYEQGWRGKGGFYGTSDEAFDSFKEVIASVAQDVNASSNPIELVKTVKEALERVKTSGEASNLKYDEAQYKKWIPNTPEKLAAYVAIFGVVYSILTKEPDKPVNTTTITNEINITYTIKRVNSKITWIKN